MTEEIYRTRIAEFEKRLRKVEDDFAIAIVRIAEAHRQADEALSLAKEFRKDAARYRKARELKLLRYLDLVRIDIAIATTSGS